METVFVGLSGGVDSSVTAALLKEQGYNVVGVYMKNWAQDLPGWECPWEEDFRDAKRVAVQLGIDFELFDFQEQYHEKVVDYMIESYQRGLTPNPDIMCNQEIKFKLFLDASLEAGADSIATGHYARTQNGGLYTARDEWKDQTYFLYRVTEEALRKSYFPVGDFDKQAIRSKATELGLVTAGKKDSQGICFVGKVGIRDFLENYVQTEPGPIVDQDNNEIGQHDGAIFYTIGQRHGLGVGGGLPYYVTHKDMSSNTVFVTSDIQDENLWSTELRLVETHWIQTPPLPDATYKARLRHQGELISCRLSEKNGHYECVLDKDFRAASPGQSVVVYDGHKVLGGGVISKVKT